MSLVWINGRLVDKSEAKISVFDHGFLFADGAWMHLRAFDGALFHPDNPLLRFLEGLKREHGIDVAMDVAQLRSAIEDTLRANGRTEGYIRVLATRGVGTLGPDPRKILSQVHIVAEEYHPFPIELYEHGLDVVSSTIPTRSPRSLGDVAIAKAKRDALAAGCLEAVMIDGTLLLGCTEGGVFVVSSGTLRCSSAGCSPEEFELVSELAASEGVTLDSRVPPLEVASLAAAEEAFLVGTACGVIAIARVDGRPIGGGAEGPVTRRIRDAYRKLTRGTA